MVQKHKPPADDSVPRRRAVRAPLPFAAWEPWELAGARNISDNQQYDEITAGKIDCVLVGRLKRIPYAAGKARLGDLTDEQILVLRQHLAERRIARLGDRAIVQEADWTNPSRSRSHNKEEEAPAITG
jgi:hypothetical protein